MSTLLVSKDSFVGEFELPRTTATDPLLQASIDKYEKKYIRELLGVVLGNLFIADKANPSQDPRFVVIEDPFAEQLDECGGRICESAGMARLLTALIYYHHVIDTQVKVGQSGAAISQVDTASVLMPRAAARKAEARWNDALDDIEAIQWYCREFASEDYPEYKGVRFDPQYSSSL